MQQSFSPSECGLGDLGRVMFVNDGDDNDDGNGDDGDDDDDDDDGDDDD